MIRGGCQCGFVRYEITEQPSGLTVCHCIACQKQSGSAFGMSLDIPTRAFRLLAGSVKTFEVVCHSGRNKVCAFCPECGSRISHQSEHGMSIKAGTLDDTSHLSPEAHYWTKRRQRWVDIPESAFQCIDDG